MYGCAHRASHLQEIPACSQAGSSTGRTGTREVRRKALVRMDRLDPALSGSKHAGYRFGEFRLEPDGTLLHGEAAIPLDARELAALRLLLEHRGQVVSLPQLKQALFGDESVAAENVAHSLASLIKHLGPTGCIHSAGKRGYRFTAEAHRLGPAALPHLPRLAILPFAATYGVPEFLGPALAEDTAAQLGGGLIPVAAILARDSIFALARRGIAPREIGEKMKADLVLGGELRAMATHYRLRAEMIQVEDGSQLWAEDILVGQSLILELVRDLAQRVARRLSVLGLTPAAAAAPPEPAPAPTPEQREAYELFARSRHEWQTLERHRMQDAVAQLERAIELDPQSAGARVHLVDLCFAQVVCGFLPPLTGLATMRRAAGSLDQLPPRTEALLPALGWTEFHAGRDLPTALRAFVRSAHLPHGPWATRARVLFAVSRRHFGKAIELQRGAIAHDPYSPWLVGRLAWVYHLAGETTLSLQAAHAALKQFPGEEGPAFYGAMVLAFNGEASKAVEVAQALERRVPFFDPAAAVHAYALAQAGRGDEARAILERLQWLRRERYAMNTFAPAAYVALGDHDAAIAELRSADSLRSPWFFQMLADPRICALHQHPEFAALNGILESMEAEVAGDPASE
jgi:TolB-like protein